MSSHKITKINISTKSTEPFTRVIQVVTAEPLKNQTGLRCRKMARTQSPLDVC